MCIIITLRIAISASPPRMCIVKLTYWSSGRMRIFHDVYSGGGDGGNGPDDVPGFLGLTGLANNRVKTIYRVCCIVDGPYSAVGLHKTVLTANHITSPLFRLVFDISRGGIVHAVLVSVARWNLQFRLRILSVSYYLMCYWLRVYSMTMK